MHFSAIRENRVICENFRIDSNPFLTVYILSIDVDPDHPISSGLTLTKKIFIDRKTMSIGDYDIGPLKIRINYTVTLQTWQNISPIKERSRHMKFRFLSHMRAPKVQTSMCICAVLSKPSLLAVIKFDRR